MKMESKYNCGNEDTRQNSVNLMNIIRKYPAKYTCRKVCELQSSGYIPFCENWPQGHKNFAFVRKIWEAIHSSHCCEDGCENIY